MEVRADGDLRLATDWALPSTTALRDASPHAGDTSVTLRAPGTLTLAYGLSAGFDATTGLIASERGGTLRATGGADLAAAQVTTTTGSTADVVIGRASANGFDAPPAVAVRSTTGSIDITAARDLKLLNDKTAVYTSGTPVGTGADLNILASDLAGQDASVSPLLAGGGAVRLNAGRDVIGSAPAATSPYFTSWWWRASLVGTEIWWSRYDLFSQGVATFGGGDITARAGRDLVDLHAAAASSGLNASAEANGGQALALREGGGSVIASAGRDVVSGLLYAGGPRLAVDAVGSITRHAAVSAADPGLQLAHEATAISVDAGGDLRLASVRDAGLTARDPDNTLADVSVITGLGHGASLSVQSAAGSIRYDAAAQPLVGSQSTGVGVAEVGQLLPSTVRIAAPNGAVTLANSSTVQSVEGSRVDVLAGTSLQVESLRVTGLQAPPVQQVTDAAGLSQRIDPSLQLGFFSDAEGSRPNAESPLRLVAEGGDVTIANLVAAARAVRISAGRDVVLGPQGRLRVQHPAASADGGDQAALSLIQAGRDLRESADATNNISAIQLGGPGDLVVLAGRHVDLGAGRGIATTGNNDNPIDLPAGGAAITLVAGLRAEGSDYERATREGYALLGGSGFASHAGDLYALLSGAAGTPGSAVARAFEAQPIAAKLEAIGRLLGSGYDAARIAYARGLAGNAALTDAQALAAFDALPADPQGLAASSLLARAFGALPAATRIAFAAALAQADIPAAQQQAFKAYVRAQTGSAPASLAQAMSQFEQLPLERRVPWLNQVLVDDLRTWGRQAAATAGDERAAAYARAYLSIDTLFPAAATRQGDILLPTSQVRTAQDAGITLMAPGGGVNAGELVGSGTRSAADLGIITTSGGDVSAVVKNDFAVNQSRVFSLGVGDILLWASEGNIDAGRGGKTVTGAPAPVFKLDAQGRITVDTSGSFSGSGIAVLDSGSFLDLYAPRGEINTGDAGIKSAGSLFVAAQTFRGADNLSVGGAAVGAPPPPPAMGATAGLASAQNTVSSATQGLADDSDEDRRKRRRTRRTLLVDFLGFGS